MIHEIIKIQEKGSTEEARLITYMRDIRETSFVKERPCVLIMPGGGYNHLSVEKEGESFAMQMCAMGYHAAVLEYSVAPATYPTQLLEVARAIKIIREHAKEWKVDPNKIFVCGSSAGGHLAANYGCCWHEDFVAEAMGVSDKEILRPNGMILCYAVATSGENGHRGSFVNLCGDRYDELVDKISIEKIVNEYTPRAFIWHTFTDKSVPVENALLLASALRKQDIPFELHIYPVGKHGLGLADWTTQNGEGTGTEPQCQSWIRLLKTWLEHF